jgi:hypothetical protein
MAEIARLERTKAKKAPGEAFSSPDEIIGNIIMTRGEKLAVLRLWRQQLQEDIAAWVEMRSQRELQRLKHLLLDIERSIDELVADDQPLTREQAN